MSLDIFSQDFILRGLYAGFLCGIICGLIGPLVVTNRLVFVAGGLAHGVYGGLGLAAFFSLSFLGTSLAFGLFLAFVMARVLSSYPKEADTLIGVIWSAGMAMGIILVDFTPGYVPDLGGYLFGSILAVTPADIWAMLILCVAVLCLVTFFYRGFQALSFDAEFAMSRGQSVNGLRLLFFSILALSLVLVIRVVGLILIIALVCIPAQVVLRHSSSLWQAMFISALLGCALCLLGLTISIALDLTSGASIVALATLVYAADKLWSKLLRR